MFFKKKKKKIDLPELYSEEETTRLEQYIEANFGVFDSVFHEIVSPDIHVDIAIIKPTPSHNYYTLVTMGMGAHKMNVPSELSDLKLERAELLIHLSADWNVQSDEETWYWPLRWLKILARLPIEQSTWLGYGHTIPAGTALAENTELSGILLTNPFVLNNASATCKISDSDVVNFYQVIPIYEEEMNYKLQNDADALLEKLSSIDYQVLDIKRNNVCL